jgi:NAD(P)-dependent dehydrogenase (short-subunit alcohol dehydrogenase family)
MVPGMRPEQVVPQLEGQVVLVTGGASGMGLASAAAFAAHGALVIVGDLDGGAAGRAAQAIRADGGQANAYQVDVASVTQLESMFDWLGRTYGKLNVLFSHAGVPNPIGLEVTEEQFDRGVDVNFKSHFFATRHALALLRESAPQASIIYTSSAAGLRSCAPSPIYGALKAAIISLARSMAVLLGPDGIRVNAICPGGIDTSFSQTFRASSRHDPEHADEQLARYTRAIPLGRIGQADDIAPAAVFLASDQARYVTGTWLPVDGGLTA